MRWQVAKPTAVPSLEKIELPPAMRAFATQQSDRLQAALRLYPLRGVAALWEAVEGREDKRCTVFRRMVS